MDALNLKRKPLGAAWDERARRLAYEAEAKAPGWGGIQRVHEATGMSRGAIGQGIRELEAAALYEGRIRRPGGGRKRQTLKDPPLEADLQALVEPTTRGDPAEETCWGSG